jgi:hypothetical protein
MRYVLALGGWIALSLGGLLSAAGQQAAAEEAAPQKPRAIIELFTSQGCSSCVAADAYFEELADRGDVVALSFHVDYWDYLGWRDTLADPAYTERQRDYAAVHGIRRVYTPQMIVNGSEDFVGSDRTAVDAAIEQSSLIVPVAMRHGGGKVEIKVAALPDAKRSATIRLVLVSSEKTVEIQRGENAGSTLEYYNVVRAIRPIGMWSGEEVRITLPEEEIMPADIDGCAIIVQTDHPNGPGPIIGAAMLGGWRD